ncbi:5-methyltetrahydropteroyltriglutamate--homocysteine S-methyltransferase [Paenibacillus sp. UMB4589-SE434]|uniref:5-methyltetrahydropteroyltriglutamate-- homocysteine S-methyltransferase n=1 Tax=Paenibacillus sp. UMB4589-SE434 TaxID=3046314 RepID=UPI00254EF36F|nr:5-methyltetrahydropteroyltriglutamate--homocysteine S-methyltransferase [Paenibacillus sp. UMB4589-SE434]MDK8180607.1 5-methyltetrahydropteroyltriglutamate--homocysteine S-methyltransferase [Paenibacillus sp. UMB4589-SE434]
MGQLNTSVIGYPRIGYNREWKKALEQYWGGKTSSAQLETELNRIEAERLTTLVDAKLSYVPVQDYTWYDHVLDTAVMFDIIPERFRHEFADQLDTLKSSQSDAAGTPQAIIDVTFGMARGTAQSTACEMTKWFNTNYHYIVPEWEDRAPELLYNHPVAAVRRAKQAGSVDVSVWKPVLVGPYTFVRLMKGIAAADRAAVAKQFAVVYGEVLVALAAEGVTNVQLDEPGFVLPMNKEEWVAVKEIYTYLRAQSPSLSIWVQTYFESVSDYESFVELPVDVLGLDLVHGKARNLEAIQKLGFPADKRIALGVIDGRNIWKTDLAAVTELLTQYVKPQVPAERWIVQPSCSLLHVPLTLSSETELPEYVRTILTGADEKLVELELLAQHLANPTADTEAGIVASAQAVAEWRSLPERNRPQVKEELLRIQSSEEAWTRVPFSERLALHQARWSNLPLLPTTSIGSLPQTAEVRKARLKFRKGEWSEAAYTAYLQAEMKRWIDIQEQIGIDVLVHGEFERTDMVEYFGEKLEGFVFTKNGWVQSYGSRCVKPPVLYGDVAFVEAMTVVETEYAQSLTSKPVKGMLTGPVTILNWSFVRDDISREEAAYQLSWALRQEIQALEEAGIGMIQVDEPAVKEGMPLHPDDKQGYREWTVKAFRLTTSGVKPETQVHTHMCYCDFSDMVDLIREMDADVISVETARSGGDIVEVFAKHQYELGIGLGVYDIHSPRIPATAEMASFIESVLQVMPARTFWINPDCGLKTRNEQETIAALSNMVKAAEQAREHLTTKNS